MKTKFEQHINHYRAGQSAVMFYAYRINLFYQIAVDCVNSGIDKMYIQTAHTGGRFTAKRDSVFTAAAAEVIKLAALKAMQHYIEQAEHEIYNGLTDDRDFADRLFNDYIRPHKDLISKIDLTTFF